MKINQQNIWQIRRDFPIFENNPNLVYFDNAATSQIPRIVVEKMNDYYYNYRANVGRTSGKIAAKSDNLVENIRSQIAKFFKTQSSQIIWTSGSTESLNLTALSLYKYFKKIEIEEKNQNKIQSKIQNNIPNQNQLLKLENLENSEQSLKQNSKQKIINQNDNSNNFLANSKQFILSNNSQNNSNLQKNSTGLSNLGFQDNFETKSQVIITQIEHHSNFLVWSEYFEPVFWEIKKNTFWLQDLISLVNKNTKVLAITQVSNFTGQILPIKEIITKIRSISPQICVVLDGSQAVFNLEIDLEDLDCDFYCFSGHKILAPNGISVLWAKEKWLKKLETPKFGGGMVDKVGFETIEQKNKKEANFEKNLENLENDFWQECLKIPKTQNINQKEIQKENQLLTDNSNLANLVSLDNSNNSLDSFLTNSQIKNEENSKFGQQNHNQNQQNQLELIPNLTQNSEQNEIQTLQRNWQNWQKNQIKIHSTWQPFPHSWEAGTPNIAGIIGLGAAIEYFQNLEKTYNLTKYKNELWEYLKTKIEQIPNICLIKPVEIDSEFWQNNNFQKITKQLTNQNSNQNIQTKTKIQNLKQTQKISNLVSNKVSKKIQKTQASNFQVPILTFYHNQINSLDLASLLATFDICLRSGSLCCQPFLANLATNSVLRVSLNFYNTKTEIDFFVDKLLQVIEILS